MAVDLEEEEAGMSSPNSTISSVRGKRREREPMGSDEHELERDCSQGLSDGEDGDGSQKNLRLSKDQSAILEERFKEHNTLNPVSACFIINNKVDCAMNKKQKLALSKRLGPRPRQVEVWFQNKRARTKLEQAEVDCEFLKRCCENLTEENRRLKFDGDVVLKRATEYGAVEIWMNECVRRACANSCADFLYGFLESSSKKGAEYWLIWRYEGEATLVDLLQSKEFPYNMADPLTALIHEFQVYEQACDDCSCSTSACGNLLRSATLERPEADSNQKSLRLKSKSDVSVGVGKKYDSVANRISPEKTQKKLPRK